MQTAGDFNLNRDTKYRHIPQNEPLWVLCDFGNKDVKAMIHANFGEEIWFPNYLCYLSADEYAAQEATYRNRPAEYEQSALFSRDGRGVIVGDLAINLSNSEQRKGSHKYGEYMRDMFVATMLHLYPEGHKKVNLVVTHPAKLPNTELEALRDSFKGEINIETVDGREVSYLVKKVVMIEEPIAAFQTYALNTSGTDHQRREMKLQPGMQFAICDVGGYISHLALGRINSRGGVEIAAVNLEPIEYGIHHVIKNFEAIARNKIPELSKQPSLPIERVTEALKTDTYRIRRSDTRNVENVVNDAFKPLFTSLRETWENPPFREGLGLDGVILTAGGNALAQEYLTRNLFGDDFAVPAEDDVERMRFCAIRGASKGLIAFLAQADYQQRKVLKRA
jgi:hypothetical protein